LLGEVGREDPKAFPLIAETATKAYASSDFNLASASGEALVSLGDPRGLPVLEQIGRNESLSQRQRNQISGYQDQLRKLVAGTPGRDSRQP
jgi:hypothetical protein